jgi:hypothetical protein
MDIRDFARIKTGVSPHAGGARHCSTTYSYGPSLRWPPEMFTGQRLTGLSWTHDLCLAPANAEIDIEVK